MSWIISEDREDVRRDATADEALACVIDHLCDGWVIHPHGCVSPDVKNKHHLILRDPVTEQQCSVYEKYGQ